MSTKNTRRKRHDQLLRWQLFPRSSGVTWNKDCAAKKTTILTVTPEMLRLCTEESYSENLEIDSLTVKQVG